MSLDELASCSGLWLGWAGAGWPSWSLFWAETTSGLDWDVFFHSALDIRAQVLGTNAVSQVVWEQPHWVIKYLVKSLGDHRAPEGGCPDP